MNNPEVKKLKNNKRYNHCPQCGKSLGCFNFFKFWAQPTLCPSCQKEAL